jgi:hypothetical protein
MSIFDGLETMKRGEIAGKDISISTRRNDVTFTIHTRYMERGNEVIEMNPEEAFELGRSIMQAAKDAGYSE